MPLDPLELLKVHHTQQVGDEEKIVRVTPYLAVAVSSHPKLFLKNGKVWDAGGREVAEPPPGFWAAAAKCSAKALQEVGFDPVDVQNLNDQEEQPATTSEPEPTRKRR